MFGSIGFPELIVILVVALLVIGPQRLPEVAQSLGRALRELKRATSDLQSSIDLDEEFETEPKPGPPAEENKLGDPKAEAAGDETPEEPGKESPAAEPPQAPKAEGGAAPAAAEPPHGGGGRST